MPKVICKLENASGEINGVKFEPVESGGMLSEELDDETAAHFASIAGYAIWNEDGEPVKRKPGRPPKAADPATQTPTGGDQPPSN